MGYRKHLFNPDAKRAEAEMRERERIKDAAYESFELLKECLAAMGSESDALRAKLVAHVKMIEG